MVVMTVGYSPEFCERRVIYYVPEPGARSFVGDL